MQLDGKLVRGDRKVFLSLSQAENGQNFVCLGPQRRLSANEWCGLPPIARKPTSGCHTYAHVFEQPVPCLLEVFWKGMDPGRGRNTGVCDH